MNMSTTGMNDREMTPKSVHLAGSPSPGKHAGQRVAIRGSLSHESAGEMHAQPPTFTVVSLKVLSKSCS